MGFGFMVWFVLWWVGFLRCGGSVGGEVVEDGVELIIELNCGFDWVVGDIDVDGG